MRRLLAALLLLTGTATADSRPAAWETPVDLAHPSAEWRPIFTALARSRAIESGFVENRYHRVRRKPFTSPGVMRYDPATGISLARTTDSGEEVVLVKPDGLYRREADKFEKIPYDVAATRAPRLLLSVVAFDPARIAQEFTVTGAVTGDTWRLELTPKSADLRKVVSKLTVEGSGERLTQITLHDDDFIRLEIFIHSVAFPEKFPAEVRKNYFGN